jgi:putative SOS response-associated peptidase YedK
MCGRYVSTKSSSDLLEEFDAVYPAGPADAGSATPAGAAAEAAAEKSYPADYNVAPTKLIRMVVNRPPRAASPASEQSTAPIRQLRLASWGLVPSWAKDRSIGAKLINARAESLTDKPAFRSGFARRRCLIPADGWYEWLRTTDAAGRPFKQPYFMTPEDQRSLALAGLYEFWKPKDAGPEVELLLSATIVTVAAQGRLAEIHDRMPLVIDRAEWTRWLDPTTASPTDLLTPSDEAIRERLELRPVSAQVNNVTHNAPELVDEVSPSPAALELF